MRLEDFVKSSERTLSSGMLKIDKQIEVNLLHSAIGISTEVGEIVEAINCKKDGEVDIVNIAEEAADVMWYLAIAIRDYGLDFKKLKSMVASPKIDIPRLIVDSLGFLDMLKKVVFYGIKIDGFLVDHYVGLIYQHIISISSYYKFDLETAMSNNQDKLKARYPDKFDDSNALNRDLEKERTELEKGM